MPNQTTKDTINMPLLKAPTCEDMDQLKQFVGEAGWLSEPDIQRYLEDPRDNYAGNSEIVFRPANTQEASKILAFCNAKGIGVIPYSGGTGVVAGQLGRTRAPCILVSTDRMNSIRSLSMDDDAIVAEAGCILADVQNKAFEVGKMFPVSMGSQGSCRIGGNMATNAGGIQVLRYGNMRDNCLGIEAVMPDGTVLNGLNALRKDNTGYDLRHLLIGSEGTLGLITAATLKLAPLPHETATAFCAVSSPADVVSLLHELRETLGDIISAIELMNGLGLTLLLKHVESTRHPFSSDHGWYCLIEAAGQIGTRERLEAALAKSFESGLLIDAVLAESEAQRQSLWDLREKTPEANRHEGAICNSDTSVPITDINKFIEKTDAAIHQINSGLRTNCYGHIGDGNIHYNVFPPDGVQKAAYLNENPTGLEQVRMAINETTHACGGSISAEHGIGRLKTGDLSQYCDPTKLVMMRTIKQAIDPNGIMNPGVLFD